MAKSRDKALAHGEVAGAIQAVRASTSNGISKLAFEFVVLTASRIGEVLGARWSEIDLDARIWTIPASRMKAEREHRVPLSDRAIEILRETGDKRTGLVFGSPWDRAKPLDQKTLRTMLKQAGVDSTLHGFRSSFRDWCGDTGKEREIAEMALAHTVRNAVEAAYARSDLFDRRVTLMQQWADYVNPSK